MNYRVRYKGGRWKLIITVRDKYDCNSPLGRGYMALSILPKKDLERLTDNLRFYISMPEDAIQWLLSKASLKTYGDFKEWHKNIKNQLSKETIL